MKQIYKILVTLVLTFTTFLSFAYDFAVDNSDGVTIYYRISSESEKTVAVVSSPNGYAGEINIPATVTFRSTTYDVTAIEAAFTWATNVTAVTIPESITEILSTEYDQGAFWYSGITSPVYNSKVFGYLPQSYSGAYSVPDGITKIAPSAFLSCSELTEVNIPNSVTSIGATAFMYCSKLQSISIPNSVTYIGDGAFTDCSALTSPIYNSTIFAFMPSSYSGAYSIPDGITTIAGEAFSSCTNLSSVAFPSSVTEIGYGSFAGCSRLKSVTLPSGLISLGSYAFNLSGLTTITIPNSTQTIGDCAFLNCTSLTSVNMGNSVTNIGFIVFSGCPNLSSFTGKFASEDNRCLIVDGELNNFAPSGITTYTIPNNVTSIGPQVFSSTNITAISIPNSVQRIGKYAFSGCKSLTSIYLPPSVTEVGDRAFYDTGIASPVYNSSVFAYMPQSYSGSYSIAAGIKTIAPSAFYKCVNLTNVTIPNSLTSIGNYAFYGCSSLTTISVPNSVTSLGNYAFYGCSSLTSVTLGNAIPVIDYCTFSECSNLTSITIPNSVTSIGNSAFSNCTQLASVTIGKSVKYINYLAFADCLGLKTIYSYPAFPPVCGINCFNYIDKSLCKVYVPERAANDYRSAAEWSDFNIVGNLPNQENYLIADKITTHKGTSVTLPINMTNTAQITAFQCDITLPSGIDLAVVEDEYDITLSSRASRTHIVSSSDIDFKTVRVLCYSTKSTAFTGNEGTLFNLPITPISKSGTYVLEIKNIVLADCNGVEYIADDFAATIDVLAYGPGDANGDGTINVTDVVFTTNYILGYESPAFIFDAADINEDKVINVTDVVLIVNKVLQATDASPLEMEEAMLAEATVTSMYANDFSINSGETKEFDVVLDNPDFALTAFQFNMTLPKGLSIVEEDGDFYIDQTSRATRSHTVSASLNNGIYTVIDYSSKSSNFSGNSGAVLTITVKADADFAGGELKIYNVVTTESDGTEHKLDATTATVTNPSGIDTIDAPQGEAKYYNLLGIPVNGTPETGVYIEVRDGASRKGFVK